jgi:hypothetical protein
MVGNWIYNYQCNQCLSPLKLWVGIPLMVRCTQYNIMWFSLGTAISSTNKTDRHDIAEILLKVPLKNINQLHQNKHDSINLSWPLLLIWNLVYTCPVEYFQRYSTRSFVGIYFYLNDMLNYNMYIICIFFKEWSYFIVRNQTYTIVAYLWSQKTFILTHLSMFMILQEPYLILSFGLPTV